MSIKAWIASIVFATFVMVGLMTLTQPRPTVQAAPTPSELPDLCMDASGHPVYLEVMGDHSGVYATYLTKDGDLVVRYITIWTDSQIHLDAYKVMSHGACPTSQR